MERTSATMNRNLLVEQLIGQDQQSLRAYEIYRQTADIYYRAKAVIGGAPKYRVHISSTKSVKVENGTTWSSKIFTCK